eukprot:gene4552-5573_t
MCEGCWGRAWASFYSESEAPSEAPRQWKKFDAPEGFSVFVGDLGGACSQEELQKALSSFGEVRSTRIIGDKGYGFAEFAQRSAAEEAIAASEEAKFAGSSSSAPQIRGQRIRVSWAHGKLPEWKADQYVWNICGLHRVDREPATGRAPGDAAKAAVPRPVVKASAISGGSSAMAAAAAALAREQGARGSGDAPSLPGFGEKSKSGMPSRSLVSYGDLF